tara:strand:- start:5283 stop:6143 length:861 start_codon:yes stop_codon:yes gene_type:complete
MKILESNIIIIALILILIALFPIWLTFIFMWNIYLLFLYVPLLLLLLASILLLAIRKKWKKFFIYISLIALFSFSSYYLILKIETVMNDAIEYSYQMDSKISELESLLKNGDIIFQTSTSAQSLAVQKVTNSKYSHMGIIYKEGDYFYVYEASNKVKKTKLRDWIERGENSHCVVKRLKNAKNTLSKSNLIKMKKIGEKYLGKNYDSHFGWSNEKMYCSELVWKIYKEATGIEIGGLKELKDFDLSFAESKKIIDERKIKINPNEKVISPADMFDSDLLTTVYKSN